MDKWMGRQMRVHMARAQKTEELLKVLQIPRHDIGMDGKKEIS